MDTKKISQKFHSLVKKIDFSQWRNFKIGQKYLSAFALAITLFLIAGIIVFFQLSLINKNVDKFQEDTIRTQDLSDLSSLIQTKDVQIADFMITKSSKYIDEYEVVLDQFNELVTELEPNMVTEQQQNLFNLILDYDSQMNEMFAEIIEDPDMSDNITAMRREQSNRLRGGVVEATNMLIELTLEEHAASMEDTQSAVSSSTWILIASYILAILLGAGTVILISRNISRNLTEVVNITSEVASGNLAVSSMDYKGKDEIGQLANAINQMKESIRNIIYKVSDASQAVTSRSEELTQSANEVNEGGDQIASTMQELSSGAESQANSAGDLSEGMNDFVEIVHASEQEGQEISETSNQVLKLTAEGTTLMNDSVKQMNQIDQIVSEAVSQVEGLDKQSAEISKLVLVIKDIADQTNLLSLNAAIEAARAGEHGRGFAVVADEVRKLAEQVAQSVSEITNIVENIQGETKQVVSSLNKGYEEVKEGTEQIEKTGESFMTIDSSVTEMIDKVVSISNNLKDIAKNSDQMNDLIQDIASVSEESAAGVEQAAATVQETSSAMDEISNSADELAKLAEQLNDEIRVFTLE